MRRALPYARWPLALRVALYYIRKRRRERR